MSVLDATDVLLCHGFVANFISHLAGKLERMKC